MPASDRASPAYSNCLVSAFSNYGRVDGRPHLSNQSLELGCKVLIFN